MGITEIVVLLAVGLIVLGPERLPEVVGTVAKMLGELRAASNTLMRELTQTVEEPRRAIMDFDPFNTDAFKPDPVKPEDKPSEPPPQP